MRPFIQKFPNLAVEETRSITILEQREGFPPPDKYIFVDLFCDEKNCDCRRVMISVFAESARKSVATINMAFDSNDPEPGPFIDPLNYQAEYAPYFLKLFTEIVNNDSAYLARLQRHYVMYKEKIDGKPYKGKPFEKAEAFHRDPGAPLPFLLPLKDKDQGPLPLAKELIEETIRRLADQSAKDIFDEHVQNILETKPGLTGAFLSLLLEHHGRKDPRREHNTHYQAIMTLLEEALTQLRYSLERGRKWAVEANEKIQEEMAEKAFQIEVDTTVQSDLMQALYESKLPLHPRITEKIAELSEHYNRFMARGGPPNLKRVFDELTMDGSQNSFELYDPMMAEMAALPPEALLIAANEMIQSGNPVIVDLVSLLLLHPESQVRYGVCLLFSEPQNLRVITPVMLRRMIGLRNWVLKEDRPVLDALIKSVRLARIECASMPRTTSLELYYSPFDGAGTEAIWGFSVVSRKTFMSNILLKQEEGVRETWVDTGLRKKDKKHRIEGLVEKISSVKGKKDYLDLVVSHFIHVGHQQNRVPPPGLLWVAENLVCEYWPPRPLDFLEQVKRLEDVMDPSFLTAKKVQQALGESGSWPERPFGHAWFEDDFRIDDLVKKTVALPFGTSGSLRMASERVLEEILKERRHIWGERLFWMALRSRLSIGKNTLPWRAFLIVARELLQGAPLEKIPLMRAVAERSVHSALRRIQEFPE